MSGHTWESYSTGKPFPAKAIKAGIDSDGSVVYVGRASHEGDMLPAKVIPEKEASYVSHSGREILKKECEVLATGGSKLNYVWESSSNGKVPPGAVFVGNTKDGEKLYYGRCSYQGSLTPGKIHTSHGCLYIPYGGVEVNVKNYEVLVSK